MRLESSVTSVSWIPSEAVTGAVLKGTFEAGFTHYDDPPPDELDDLEEMRAAGRFRFANHLAAWIEVEDGQIVDAGYSAAASWARRRSASPTSARPSSRCCFPTSATSPRSRARWPVRADHRRPHRAPRAAAREPPAVRAVQGADRVDDARAHDPRRRHVASSRCSARASSPGTGSTTTRAQLAAKVGLADFKDWYRDAFGKHTPWGERDSPALVTAVETALERELSATIMRRATKAEIRTLKKGKRLVEQGDVGRRALPRARRRARGRDRRRAGRRGRARRDPRRAGRARRRYPHGDPRSADRVQGRGGATRPDRPRRAPRARPREHRRETK